MIIIIIIIIICFIIINSSSSSPTSIFFQSQTACPLGNTETRPPYPPVVGSWHRVYFLLYNLRRPPVEQNVRPSRAKAEVMTLPETNILLLKITPVWIYTVTQDASYQDYSVFSRESLESGWTVDPRNSAGNLREKKIPIGKHHC